MHLFSTLTVPFRTWLLWGWFASAPLLVGDRFPEGPGGVPDFDPVAAEAALEKTPDDLDLRLGLIRHFHAQYADPAARQRRTPHVLWLIENHPDHLAAGDVRSRLHPALNGADYATGATLWQRHAETSPDDPAILANAARYLGAGDRERSIQLFSRARLIDPDNSDLAAELSLQRQLTADGLRERDPEKARALFREAFDDLKAARELARDREERFFLLTRLPKIALQAEDPGQAGDFAKELLAEAERFRARHWNHGNAVHAAHTALGRIALAEDDMMAAGRHLLLSAQTRGSPQLNSFGPSFDLAREVLATGETDAVIGYLHLCGNFWEAGRDDLDRWTEEIRRTGTTAFSRRFRDP